MLLSISQKGQKIPLCNVPQAETNIYFRVALDMDIFAEEMKHYSLKLKYRKVASLDMYHLQATPIWKSLVRMIFFS